MRRVLPAACAALIFLVIAFLYGTGRAAEYDATIRSWGVDTYRWPFLDTDMVLSAIRCLNAGVDVFHGNPCDAVRRAFDYSPLWLVLRVFPISEAWIVPTGITLACIFFLSLLLLPPGRSIGATVLITLGVCSSAVVFGVERGNNDLLLFALASAAAWLVCRSAGARLVGYAAVFLAGLLKYYPMTLMTLALRERPARFFTLVGVSLALVGLFLLTMGGDLVRALHLIPKGGWFGDMFGSSTLPGGLALTYGWSRETAGWLRLGLSVAALALGAILAFRPSTWSAFDRLSEHERTALLAGGLLILSAFFTAQNIGYRALHFLLTLPALTALSRLKAGRIWTITTWTVLALLWAQGWRDHFASQDMGRTIFVRGWMVREALWWWTVTVMIGAVTALLVRSEMATRLFPRLASRKPI